MDLDVRRCWECPACSRRIKRQGDVVSYQCHCQEPPVWMHLMEPARAAREYQPYIVPEIQADELIDHEAPQAAEAVLPEETEVLMEVALTQELLDIPVEEVSLEEAPAEEIPLEDVPAEEEFYSPEEDIVEIPQAIEAELPKLPEPVPAEPTASAEEISGQPLPNAADQNRPPGKSKRRRSGRKRHRRGKPG